MVHPFNQICLHSTTISCHDLASDDMALSTNQTMKRSGKKNPTQFSSILLFFWYTKKYMLHSLINIAFCTDLVMNHICNIKAHKMRKVACNKTASLERDELQSGTVKLFLPQKTALFSCNHHNHFISIPVLAHFRICNFPRLLPWDKKFWFLTEKVRELELFTYLGKFASFAIFKQLF